MFGKTTRKFNQSLGMFVCSRWNKNQVFGCSQTIWRDWERPALVAERIWKSAALHIGGLFRLAIIITTNIYVWIEVSTYIESELVDLYRETFGFRTIELKDNQLQINGRPFYCIGFGMHEDFDLHGRGYDPVVMTRDLNMFEWMNANCYRTSHYPYSGTLK